MKLRGLRAATRWGMGLVLVAGMALAFHFRGEINASAIRDALADKPLAPLVFILLHILASLFFVPRTFFGIAAGLAWGLWMGIVLSLAGAMAGSLVCFLLARYLNGGLIRPEKFPGLGRLLDRMERGGWRSVAFLRLVPVMPHTPVNYAFGLTQVTLTDYLFGTLIGLVPMTVFAADIGAAGGSVMMQGKAGIILTLIGVGALAVSFLLPKFLKSRPTSTPTLN